MPTISAGSSQTFTAGVRDQLFTLVVNGGALGYVTGAASASFGPGADRRAFGPFAVGQAITVTVQAGSVIVEYGDATPEDEGPSTSSLTGAQVAAGAASVAGVLSGGLLASAGGGVIAAPSQARGVYVRKAFASQSQSGAGDVSRRLILALPAAVAAAKLRLHHGYGAVTGIKAALGWSANVSNKAAPTGGMNAVTWAAASSINIGAPSSGTGNTATTNYVESDLIAVPSVAVDSGVLAGGVRPGAIAYINTYAPAAQLLGRFESSATSATFEGGGVESHFQLGVDGVATPGSFTATTIANVHATVELLCYSATDCRTLLTCGASTIGGWGDNGTNAQGWAQMFALGVTDKAVSIANSGFQGQSTIYSLPIALDAITRIKPNAAVWAGYTSNDSDSDTAAGTARRIEYGIRFIEACRSAGVVPMLSTFQYVASYTAGQNTERSAWNTFARAVAASGYARLLEIDGVVSTPSGWVNAAWTTDNLHPNATGHAVIAADSGNVVSLRSALGI